MTNLLATRDSWSMANCSIDRALSVVGTRSAILVMREAFFGTRRFDDFARRVGIGEPATAARLKELTSEGLLEKVPYQEPGQRKRFEYKLTPKGRELLPVLTALREWGDHWTADPEGPPMSMVHRGCGAAVHTTWRCENGHDVSNTEMETTAGPSLLGTAD
jgi:DNA-binding HxlR family transcriptional regulator